MPCPYRSAYNIACQAPFSFGRQVDFKILLPRCGCSRQCAILSCMKRKHLKRQVFTCPMCGKRLVLYPSEARRIEGLLPTMLRVGVKDQQVARHRARGNSNVGVWSAYPPVADLFFACDATLKGCPAFDNGVFPPWGLREILKNRTSGRLKRGAESHSPVPLLAFVLLGLAALWRHGLAGFGFRYIDQDGHEPDKAWREVNLRLGLRPDHHTLPA